MGFIPRYILVMNNHIEHCDQTQVWVGQGVLWGRGGNEGQRDGFSRPLITVEAQNMEVNSHKLNENVKYYLYEHIIIISKNYNLNHHFECQLIIIIQMKPILIISLLALILPITPASYSYSSCPAKYYLNTANLQCVACPTNQISNNYQSVPTACQCAAGYTPSSNGACTPLNTACGTNGLTYNPVYQLNGDVTGGGSTCASCATTAKANTNVTGCTPCGRSMIYDASQGCTCNGSLILSDLGCFLGPLSPSPTGSTFSSQLKYLIPGCVTYSDYLSCSYISNLCAFSLGSMSTPECQFFTTNSLTASLYPNSSAFSLTFSKQVSISLKIVSYLPTGNYLGQNTFILSSLMKCGTPQDTNAGIIMGTNIRVTCSYNVNSLIAMTGSTQWKGKVYQLLVKAEDGSYYDVAVQMPGASQTIKRFFIEDTFTNPGKTINLMTGFTLSFNYNFANKLETPLLAPSYTSITIDSTSGVVSGSSLFTMTYQVLFTSNISTFWTGALGSFIAVSVVALLHAIAKTYIGYLNKKSALQFFLNFAGVYSLWLYYYLLFMTGYWFLFTKNASTPPFLLPSHNPTLYGSFYALVGVMVAFRLIWVVVDKAEKLSTEVFVINWERSQFKNSWREIFVINSLAEFYTHRTFSIFWMLAIVLFFMKGVLWENLAAESASTVLTWKSLTPTNRIFLYFLACAVFLAVGLISKILRRASVLFWPYPFEDFADYCTIANISLLFVKRRAPHAYYLHASIPDRTEVTYKEINEAIRRGLQKNRSITSELPSIDSLRLYSIYLSKEMEDRHSNLLKVIEQQGNSKRQKFGKELTKKTVKNPREQFIENRLKPHLQSVAGGQYNQRRKSFIQNIFGTPPVDLREGRQRGKSEIFFDDQLELVNEVFPNGNQFQEMHTIMTVFLGFVALTNSTPIAAFLTYFVDQYLFKWWIETSCRSQLEEMTRVKKGFML